MINLKTRNNSSSIILSVIKIRKKDVNKVTVEVHHYVINYGHRAMNL